MKKIIISLIALGFVLVILGFLFQYNGSSKKSNMNKEDELTKEQCLEGICIKDMEITLSDDNIAYLNATIVNKTSKKNLQGFVNITFNINGEEITEEYFYNFTAKVKEMPVQIYDVDNKLVDATEYKIEKPTEEQLKYYYDNSISLD